jgi:hypothetical protein
MPDLSVVGMPWYRNFWTKIVVASVLEELLEQAAPTRTTVATNGTDLATALAMVRAPRPLPPMDLTPQLHSPATPERESATQFSPRRRAAVSGIR